MSNAFRFNADVVFFEKGNASPEKRRRIGGIISTEELDKQGEVVVQDGLDFTYFLKSGWFNDNHGKGMEAVLGYPDGTPRRFRKGDTLPDGTIAKSNGTWAEGYLLDTPRAQNVWETGQALQKSGSGRRLGFSIEGKVTRREGPGGRVVAGAQVRHVAITHVPVGEGTRLETLAKSLTAAADSGAPLLPESLESDERDEEKKDPTVEKSEAIALIKSRLGLDDTNAERVYRLAQNKETTMSETNKAPQANVLEAIAQIEKLGGPAGRKTVLLAKAANGTITADENAELVKSLQGETAVAEFTRTDKMQKAETLDVSGFLSEFLAETQRSFGVLAKAVNEGNAADQTFRVALAKSLMSFKDDLGNFGDLVKSLEERLTALESQPARGPVSRRLPAPAAAPTGKAAALEKGGEQQQQFDAQTLMKGLTQMIEADVNVGFDLVKAVSTLEGTGELDARVASAVIDFMKKKAA